jgi:hypothetical protein
VVRPRSIARKAGLVDRIVWTLYAVRAGASGKSISVPTAMLK